MTEAEEQLAAAEQAAADIHRHGAYGREAIAAAVEQARARFGNLVQRQYPQAAPEARALIMEKMVECALKLSAELFKAEGQALRAQIDVLKALGPDGKPLPPTTPRPANDDS